MASGNSPIVARTPSVSAVMMLPVIRIGAIDVLPVPGRTGSPYGGSRESAQQALISRNP